MDSPFALILVLVINGILAATIANAAHKKGLSGVGFFFLSFMTSFIVGAIVLVLTPARLSAGRLVSDDVRVSTLDGVEEFKCPFCAEWVKAEAIVCKHCGSDISVESQKLRLEIQEARRLADEAEAAERERSTSELKAIRAKRAAFRKTRLFKILIVSGSALTLATLTLVVVQTTQSLSRMEAEAKTISEKTKYQPSDNVALAVRWVNLAKNCGISYDYFEVPDWNLDPNSLTFRIHSNGLNLDKPTVGAKKADCLSYAAVGVKFSNLGLGSFRDLGRGYSVGIEKIDKNHEDFVLLWQGAN